MTKIYLRKTIIDGQAKFDLVGENLPANFLGMAADLKVLTAGGEGMRNFSLEKVELGSAFSQPEQLQPILLYKADGEEAKIVLGISLKANNLSEVKDGVLASFSLKESAVHLDFDRPVLSVFEEGRKDLNDVLWINSSEYGQGIATVGVIDGGLEEVVEAENEIIEGNSWSVEEIMGLAEEKSPLNWLWEEEKVAEDGNGLVLMGVGFGLLVLAIGLGVVFRKRLFKLIKWPKKAILAAEKG
jgi:hypothetical protein